MRRLFVAASLYLLLGLAAGVFYREFTKSQGFAHDTFTQLSVLHTHLLTLGFLTLLLVLALDKVFGLSRDRTLFTVFFWVYNAGLVLTVTMMTVTGMRQVVGLESTPALAGMAGMGHITLGIGMVILMVLLGRVVFARPTPDAQVSAG